MSSTRNSLSGSELRRKILAAGERIAGHVVSADDVPISYRLDLALEALLDFSAVTGDGAWREHAESVARRRGEARVPWRLEPFASLSWALANARQDKAALAGFVEETRAEVRDIWRSEDGLVLHPRGELRGGGYAVLIDSFAEYVSRTARAAQAAGVTGDLELEEECADQVARHREILRDAASGLWSQGRGWLKDKAALSPGAWSRGQGWLMRGFASALLALPEEGPAYFAVRSVFEALAEAVIRVQDSSGLWHALVHRPMGESAIETSGTGLMAGSIFRAVRGGHLAREPHLQHAWRAAERLVEHVDADGVVHDACYGPGPLEEEGPWLVGKFPPGDHHGPGTVLGCFAEALAMD